MRTSPSLCVLCETIGPYNAIGRVAMADVTAALDANFEVTVVAKRLDESLIGKVEWLRLFVPNRGFALQWLTGRFFIKKAIGRRHFDIIHGHQPQIADLCDVYQCHYLTRAAFDDDCLEDKRGIKRAFEWIQNRIVLFTEDYYYRRWNIKTLMLFNSDLTRRRYSQYYGVPPSSEIFLYPATRISRITNSQRLASRKKFAPGAQHRIVVGFLGGLQTRKGLDRLHGYLDPNLDIHLLVGGLYSDQYQPPPSLAHFSSGVGLVDSNEFYAACDILIVPSYFEPFGLVALEAAARGIPVIATREVGAGPHVEAAGAGLIWDPESQSLSSLIFSIMREHSAYSQRAIEWAESLSPEQHAKNLIAIYSSLAAKRDITEG